ncbi:MAG TPA: YfhO family protein [Chloroflexi bacterium]|nr:YfhO family protein [Chloroflexota bacterium]
MKRPRSLPDILIILIIVLLPLLFFWRVITPTPEDQMRIVSGDFTEQYFPLRAFSANRWAAGRVPLWNPALFGGQPALADIQSGALYPPHVIQALAYGWGGAGFPLRALEWQVILHFAIAGVGSYLLGRYWGRRSGASLKSARFMGVIVSLVFTYSGYLTGFPVQQLAILEVSAWLPWLMWLLSRSLDAVSDAKPLKTSLAAAAWAGLAFALAILAGHPQTVMYVAYLSLAYTIFRVVSFRFQVSGFRFVHCSLFTVHCSLLLHWLFALVLGLLISAAQLWPTLEFIRRSLRAKLSFEAVSAGLPLSELVSILYPGYFGGSPEYVGIFTLMLIGAAVVMASESLPPSNLPSSAAGREAKALPPAGDQRKVGGGRNPARISQFVIPKWTIFFWLGVALLAMLLAFGSNTFLYPLFYLLTPGFDAVRQQERIFLLYAFSAAVLSGYGALALGLPLPRSLRQGWQKYQRALYWVGGGALALTGLYIYASVAANAQGNEINLFYGVLRHHIFGLIIFGGGLLLIALRSKRLWRRWWGMSLIAGWLAFNLFSVNWQFNLEKRPPGTPFTPTGVSQFLIEHTANQPQPVRIASGGLLSGGNNAASVYGLEDITGNTPLQLRDAAAFAEALPSWRYWQLMNVRYVVDERDIDGPGLSRRYEADGVKVFEVGDPFPRARIVHQIIAGDDISILASGETDLKTTALVMTANGRPPTDDGQRLAVSGQLPAVARVIESQPGLLVVDADTSAEGMLVLSNIHYPGWQAKLDGQPVEIYRVNDIFQGVYVPSGQHQLVLSFEPVSFKWGIWISLAGVLVLGVVLGYERLSILNL